MILSYICQGKNGLFAFLKAFIGFSAITMAVFLQNRDNVLFFAGCYKGKALMRV